MTGESPSVSAEVAEVVKRARVRVAATQDLKVVEELDAVSFPATDAGSETAAPGELAMGIEKREVLVAEVPTFAKRGSNYRLVGFLQYFVIEPGKEYFIAGMAVDPSFRKHGVGSLLLSQFHARVIDVLPHRPIVTCTVSPTNLASLSLFLRHNFVISRLIPEFFGPGKDRFFLEWGIAQSMLPTGHSALVPTENIAYLADLISGTEYFVTKLVNMPHGRYFQVEHLGESKEQDLSSNESSVSVSFNGILLSSTTFILGLVLALRSFSPDVLVYLLAAFLFLTVSLLSYTNAIGEVSRIRAGIFARYMVFGNVVSEFGGFYPLMQIVPITVAVELHSVSLGVLSCSISAVALLLYHYFGLSMVGRYVRTVPGRLGCVRKGVVDWRHETSP